MTPLSGDYLKSLGFVCNNSIYKRGNIYIGYDGVNWLMHGWLEVNTLHRFLMFYSAPKE